MSGYELQSRASRYDFAPRSPVFTRGQFAGLCALSVAAWVPIIGLGIALTRLAQAFLP